LKGQNATTLILTLNPGRFLTGIVQAFVCNRKNHLLFCPLHNNFIVAVTMEEIGFVL